MDFKVLFNNVKENSKGKGQKLAKKLVNLIFEIKSLMFFFPTLSSITLNHFQRKSNAIGI